MKNLRTQIINSSCKLFLQSNYHSIGLNQILIHSKCTKGAFYHYFSSKEELAFKIIEERLYRFIKKNSISPIRRNGTIPGLKLTLERIENILEKQRGMDKIPLLLIPSFLSISDRHKRKINNIILLWAKEIKKNHDEPNKIKAKQFISSLIGSLIMLKLGQAIKIKKILQKLEEA